MRRVVSMPGWRRLVGACCMTAALGCHPEAPAGGRLPDSGASQGAADSGVSRDARGDASDASDASDAGDAGNASAAMDAGVATDAGAATDAGVVTDAGDAGNAGAATDASDAGDAGDDDGGGEGPCEFQQGWAKDVQGGLGGTVMRVTTLDRDGPGSLGEALAADGPRTIVFEVGGVIDLGTQSYRVLNPYVTIAGQTAPSPGITLIRGALSIATHDVVVQHLRVRPGEAGQSEGWAPDGISLEAAHDVIIDHCSLSWAIDENLSVSGPRFEGATPEQWRSNTSHRVTLSNNIVAEGLSDSTHPKGEHSKGSLIHDNVTEVLIWRNLYASNFDRNPEFKGGARGAIVNNFITNPGRYAVRYSLVDGEWDEHPHQTGMMSIVGNVLHQGLDTRIFSAFLRVSGPLELYRDDNITLDVTGNDLLFWFGGNVSELDLIEAPSYWPTGFTALPSTSVVDDVVANVGARPWDRDAIDTRIVEQALAGTGRHIDDESEGGGYPEPAPTSAPFVASAWDACLRRLE